MNRDSVFGRGKKEKKKELGRNQYRKCERHKNGVMRALRCVNRYNNKEQLALSELLGWLKGGALRPAPLPTMGRVPPACAPTIGPAGCSSGGVSGWILKSALGGGG